MRKLKLWLSFWTSIVLLSAVGKFIFYPGVSEWYLDLTDNAQNIILVITVLGALIGLGLANAFRTRCYGIVIGLIVALVCGWVGQAVYHTEYGISCALVWLSAYFIVFFLSWLIRLATAK